LVIVIPTSASRLILTEAEKDLLLMQWNETPPRTPATKITAVPPRWNERQEIA
jgi:hypothetical protein